jgi:hypothetical protein
MSKDLTDRLNELLPRLTSEDVLKGRGLGNDIPFYIFDYPATDELIVREHLKTVLAAISQRHTELKVKHVNLLEFVREYLAGRNLLERSYDLQCTKGDGALQKALKAPLHPDRLVKYFAEIVEPEKQDLVLISGVGSVWPVLRSHSLLNNLQPVMGHTPLVLFFPGRYDGQALRLFGQLKDNYYRAFRLVV